MERELADSDAALLLLSGDQQVGPGDRFIAETIRRVGLPAATAVNKIDVLEPGEDARRPSRRRLRSTCRVRSIRSALAPARACRS